MRRPIQKTGVDSNSRLVAVKWVPETAADVVRTPRQVNPDHPKLAASAFTIFIVPAEHS